LRVKVADRRQQRQFRHLQRDIVCVAVIAEGTGHAAAGTFEYGEIDVRDQAQGVFHGPHGGKRFLVTMAVQGDGSPDRAEVPVESTRAGLACQKFLDQHGIP